MPRKCLLGKRVNVFALGKRQRLAEAKISNLTPPYSIYGAAFLPSNAALACPLDQYLTKHKVTVSLNQLLNTIVIIVSLISCLNYCRNRGPFVHLDEAENIMFLATVLAIELTSDKTTKEAALRGNTETYPIPYNGTSIPTYETQEGYEAAGADKNCPGAEDKPESSY